MFAASDSSVEASSATNYISIVIAECHVATVTFHEDPKYHYDRLRHLYAGCTHVSGNLVIADLSSPVINYDLSFLEVSVCKIDK